MPASRFNVAAHENNTPTLFDQMVWGSGAAMSMPGHSEAMGLDTYEHERCEIRDARLSRLAQIAYLYLWSERVALLGRISIDDAESLIVEAIRLEGGLADSTRSKLAVGIRTFFKTLRAWGLASMDEVTSEVVLSFVTGGTSKRGSLRPSAPTTQRNRLWFVRSVVQILYEHECWDGRDLVLEGIRSPITDPSRPLTISEMEMVRGCAYNWLIPTRRPLVVALSEAGGSPVEIALVTSDDLDLKNGTVHFSGQSQRINEIPTEALDAIHRAFADGYPKSGRLVTSDSLSIERASQSVNTELSNVITEAGLRYCPGAVGKSIRLFTANQILEQQGLIAAAQFLGAESLDRVAASLRFDWKSYR